MLTRDEMQGIYLLVLTPFKETGKFDERTFRSNIQKLSEYEIEGIATTGTLGEFHTLSWKDHKKLITALVEECEDADLHTVAGCSGINTEDTIKKTQFAQEAGVEVALNTIPYYTPVTDRECVQFWQDVSEACPGIGLMVYNNPKTTNYLVGANVFSEISQLSNVVGSKEIVGYTPDAPFTHWMDIVDVSDLAHFTCDPMTVPAMMYDASGLTSENFPLWPELYTEVYRACEEEDWDRAKKLHYKQVEFTNFVHQAFGFGDFTWFTVLKAAINQLGVIDGGYPNKPFLPIPEDIQVNAREKVLEKYGEEMNSEFI